jgi:hypothetical protein
MCFSFPSWMLYIPSVLSSLFRPTIQFNYISNLLPWLISRSGVLQIHSAGEDPCFLRIPKVQSRVHKTRHWSLPWARRVQATPPYPISLRSILLIPSHLRLGLPNCNFHSRFPTDILYICLPCVLRVHIILLDLITLKMFDEYYKSLSSSLRNSFHPSLSFPF